MELSVSLVLRLVRWKELHQCDSVMKGSSATRHLAMLGLISVSFDLTIIPTRFPCLKAHPSFLRVSLGPISSFSFVCGPYLPVSFFLFVSIPTR